MVNRIISFTLITGALIQSMSPFSARANSFSGAYLAARHANAQNQLKIAAEFYEKAASFNINNQDQQARILEESVYAFILSGNANKALESAKKLIKEAPDNKIANLLILSHEFKEKQFSQAKDRLKQENSALSNPPFEGILLAWAEYGINQKNILSESLDANVADKTNIFLNNYHLGLILSLIDQEAKTNKESRTIKAFNKAGLTTKTITPRAAEAFGAYLESKNNPKAAKILYQKTLEFFPNDPIILAAFNNLKLVSPLSKPLIVQNATEGAAEIMFNIASILAENQNFDLSLFYAQLANFIRPNFFASQALAGSLYSNLNLMQDAIASYDTIPKSSPLYIAAQLSKAGALDQINQQKDSLKTLKELSEYDPNNIIILKAYAETLLYYNYFDQSIEIYNKIIPIININDSSQWNLYFNRAIAFHNINQWEKAESDLYKSIELDNNQASVWNYLGYSLIEQKKNIPEAKEMLIKASKLRPNDGYIADSLGWAYYHLGEYEKAIEQLRYASELSPQEAIINDHLGDALWKAGQQDEALSQWRHALELSQDEEDKARIEAKIQKKTLKNAMATDAKN